ncbi:MAG: hypothetical protein A2W93_04265 [Bacteroidetes bacterium GWF2_43_63]|nr:MAG: hypothetical protein A2W94_05945 [Bacteroidetes bacterium GWE2_42_42]OFY54397.1 MAG: hypothetical protein A2W93_04265 [Bacteroidetes bacterium GWF2_43_63]HBG69213.1 hypothetical protein [Bacteroidales bacterium]HCB61232.1 hypothetical protein [Bacteroidales bacterium]HCY24151.1 hypothetical protein [Bacteroidales bacterium]
MPARQLLLFLSILCISAASQAQTRSLSAGFGYGFTSPHHSDMWNYITGHAQQCHFQYLTPRDTNVKQGGHTLKVIDICLINPGNPDTMGYSIGFSPQFHFPLNEKHRSHFVLGCGIEFNTKTYTEDNCSFTAIGSHLNALIILGYKRTFELTPSWKMKAELLWTHFSNGSTKAPNLGLNIPTLGLGLEYSWNMKPAAIAKRELNEPVFSGLWQFVATGAWKQVKYEGRIKPAFSLSAEKFFPRSKSAFGIGSDLILDYSMNEKLTEFNDTIVPFSNNIKLSLKGLWTIPIGRLQIHLQAGSYLKNGNFKKEFVFERLSLRYFVSDNIGLHVALRAHFAKADAIEFGIVYRHFQKSKPFIGTPAF